MSESWIGFEARDEDRASAADPFDYEEEDEFPESWGDEDRPDKDRYMVRFQATPLQRRLGLLACDMAIVWAYLWRLSLPMTLAALSLAFLMVPDIDLRTSIILLAASPLVYVVSRRFTQWANRWCLKRAFFFAGGKIPVGRDPGHEHRDSRDGMLQARDV